MRMNSIHNILICEKDNSVNLVKINLDKTIREIIPTLNRSISWDDISTVSKRKRFISNLESSSNNLDVIGTNGDFLLFDSRWD